MAESSAIREIVFAKISMPGGRTWGPYPPAILFFFKLHVRLLILSTYLGTYLLPTSTHLPINDLALLNLIRHSVSVLSLNKCIERDDMPM